MASYDQIAPSALYKTALVREVSNALREAFNDTYPDPHFANIYVGPEYQEDQSSYPMILITFSEQMVKRMGIGHYLIAESETTGETVTVYQWFFQGAISFNVMARTSFERDKLADALLGVIGFGKTLPGSIPESHGADFHDEIEDNDYIILHLMHDQILPSTQSVMPAPWGNENDHIYHLNYSVACTGEFFSSPRTRQLMRIGKIRTYPYRPDQPIPQGSQLPQDKPIRWV